MGEANWEWCQNDKRQTTKRQTTIDKRQTTDDKQKTKPLLLRVPLVAIGAQKGTCIHIQGMALTKTVYTPTK